MRLRRLELAFFGHFAGKTLEFGPPPEGADVHVIYGPNEAGKTTAMEGYLRLLYGFPHRETYDFLHGRPNLRLSGAVEIDGAAQGFTRLPTRKGNLLDATGTAVPETALSAALAGLTEDDYRKLLCLDDATIEEGGEEIAASKGDIGRLLFSAAAGVSDLGTVLDGVAAEADGLYRKRASKSEHAELKRRLDEVSQEIRERDINAAGYRQLREALTAAEAEEAEARTARSALISARTEAQALADALPLRAEIAELEAELAPLALYPERLDIDPEDLVRLLSDRTGHLAELKRLTADAGRAGEERDALDRAPDLAAAAPRISDLQALRGRAGNAEEDLPRRKDDAARLAADMAARLAEIGIDGGQDPGAALPDAPTLQTLDRLLSGLAAAETRHAAAAEEVAKAIEASEDATARCQKAEATLDTLPDLQPLLERRDAARLLPAHAKAQEAVRHAARHRAAALDALTLGARSFDVPPALPLTAPDAADLAHRMARAETDATQAAEAAADASEEVARLTARIEAMEAAAGLITDAEAAASRTERDALWQAHLDDFAADSAAAFEAAMRADDARRDTRQAQATELGGIRQLREQLAEATATMGARRAARDRTAAAREALAGTLAGHLTTLGLPADLSAESFADWMRRAEVAREADQAHAAERTAARPLAETAEALRAALAEALAEPDAELDALVAIARDRIATRNERQSDLRSAAEAAEEARTEVTRRARRRDEAAQSLDRARAALEAAVAEAFGSAGPAVPLADALPVLRGLREAEVKRQGLQRQIDGMTRDLDAFSAALAPLLSLAPDLAGLSPLAAYDALAARVDAALAAEARHTELSEALERAARARADTEAALARIDEQTRLYAAAFDPAIPTDTLDDLRTAVTRGHRTIALREAIADRLRRLCHGLGAPDRAAAEARLDGQDPAAAAARLDEIERDLGDAETRLERAIEARTEARRALEAVTGSADVAALGAERQTLEVQIEDVLLRHMELRLGHRLAETAIRRYRDVHRSGMMQAAEAAFRDLTQGAYARLTAQTDGGSEVLVAVSSDGAAKQVQDLSKGTRFQLYLALRAAAYDQMVAQGTVLPFFCDDVFETFDEDRTRAACALLARIGRAGQAIYLTHHRHVVEIAQEVCGMELRVHEL
ncbi:AAA family ATPase [Psychromarinibacter sp. C21-152]|uniref:AAA family ATPase n=1 Tax=Psychromarinibacter sediminicola TaxID=3033385 RepID=A0AAE3NPH2_9RHOB|nr:YhaN family protein [Psychromarinibacter sediminicola]MDF0599264.1 AAA family ATPase [Psychromarinibacter sediminicola]